MEAAFHSMNDVMDREIVPTNLMKIFVILLSLTKNYTKKNFHLWQRTKQEPMSLQM
jgi:hypothetical protein